MWLWRILHFDPISDFSTQLSEHRAAQIRYILTMLVSPVSTKPRGRPRGRRCPGIPVTACKLPHAMAYSFGPRLSLPSTAYRCAFRFFPSTDPTCSDTQTAAWEHAFQIAHWLLTAMLKPSEGSTGKRRDGTAVVWNNRSNTPTSVTQIPTSIGPKELPSEK